MTAAHIEQDLPDVEALVAILSALRRPCECESGDVRDECRAEPLNRWWIAIVTGEADA